MSLSPSSSWQATGFGAATRFQFYPSHIELTVELLGHATHTDTSMALQCWVDDRTLLAEWPLPVESKTEQIELNFHLTPPAGSQARHFALVLVAHRPGKTPQLLARQAYLLPHAFQQPRLDGAVHCSSTPNTLRTHLECIRNPREPYTAYGALMLELWQLTTTYQGAAFSGRPLGCYPLGYLEPQQAWQHLDYDWDLPTDLAAGTLTLMLREWTPEAGYVTRDWRDLTWPCAPLLAINRCTARALTTVPGVSKRLAQTLVGSRPFEHIDDLQLVRGMTPKVHATLRDRVTL